MEIKSLPRPKSLRQRFATYAVVGSLAATGVVGLMVEDVSTAPDASAHTNSVVATCTDLSLNLQNFHAIVPGRDAVPGTPGQDYVAPTYETIVVPEIPAIPAVPATYVQEFKYVQHQTGKTKWMLEGWNGIVNGVDNGKGWAYVQPLQSRDTTKQLTPYIPEVPAVPATTKQGAMIDPGQPYIAPTEEKPAVPAKVNTVTVTIQPVSGDAPPFVETKTFGESFVKTYDFVDKTVAYNWSVKVVALNNPKYNLDRSGTSTPCLLPVVSLTQPTVVQAVNVCTGGVPSTTEATVTLPTVEHAAWGNYGQDEHGVIHNVAPGSYTYTATVDSGYKLEPAEVTVVVDEPAAIDCQPPVVVTAPPAASPATCEADGTLPTLPTSDDYTFVWNRPFDGPGTYIAIATLNDKDKTQTSFEVVVAAKLSGAQCATVVTPVAPALVKVTECGVYGSVTPVETPGVVYEVTSFNRETGDYVVTATPADETVKFDGVQTVAFTGNVGAYFACPTPVTIIAVQPLPPTFNDVCGTVGDRTDGPLDTEEYTYSKSVDGTKVTVRVIPRDQYTHFAERDNKGNIIVTEWTHTFTDESCPTETATPTPTQSATPSPTATQQPTPTATKPAVIVPQGTSAPTAKSVTPVAAKNVLAYTGISPVVPIGLALALLLIGGIVLFVSRRHWAH